MLRKEGVAEPLKPEVHPGFVDWRMGGELQVCHCCSPYLSAPSLHGSWLPLERGRSREGLMVRGVGVLDVQTGRPESGPCP